MARFLRQLKTGRLYPYTATLAKRADMVPHDTESAQRRIEALKRRVEDMDSAPQEQSITKEDLDQAKEIADLENILDKPDETEDEGNEEITPERKFQTDEEIEEEEKNKRIAEDPDIIKINKMRKKAQVEEYLLVEFGEEVSSSDLKLDDMKRIAVDFRINRLFENEKA